MRSGPVSIIGGSSSLPIPWQVHIHITKESERKWCGGTILDAKTILSAAHCFDYYDKAIVEAGFTNHNNKYWLDKSDADYDHFDNGPINIPVGSSMQIRVVEEIIKHHDFNKRSYDSDVAIVKLESPLIFTNQGDNPAQPACLPDPFSTPDETGQMAVASGWGYTGTSERVPTQNLQYITVPLIPRDKCSRPSTNYASSEVTTNMICAGFLNKKIRKDVSVDDSGGPLIVPKANDMTAVIHGITSWTKNAYVADPKYPGVYTRVANFVDWIRNNMEGKAKCDAHQFTCSNRRCIPSFYKCNGHNDCGDGSDEKNCVIVPAKCDAHEFTCSNRRCIPSFYKCNGHNDCQDGSDEKKLCSSQYSHCH